MQVSILKDPKDARYKLNEQTLILYNHLGSIHGENFWEKFSIEI